MRLTENKLKNIIFEELSKLLESTRDFYYLRSPRGWITDVDGDAVVVSYRDKGTGFTSRRAAERFARANDIEIDRIQKVSSSNISVPGIDSSY